MKKSLLVLPIILILGCKSTKDEIKDLKGEVYKLKTQVEIQEDRITKLEQYIKTIKNLEKRFALLDDKISALYQKISLIGNKNIKVDLGKIDLYKEEINSLKKLVNTNTKKIESILNTKSVARTPDKLIALITKNKNEIDLLKEKLEKIKISGNTNNFDALKQLQEKVTSLENEIKDLEYELDDFVKENELKNFVTKQEVKKLISKYLVFKPTVFITVRKTKVYNSAGKVVIIWNKNVTFTSYIKKGNKLRVTGYFPHKRFKSALKKDWWINIKDVKVKKHEN